MHIGLIGGIGPAATEFYYRKLVAGFKRINKPLDLTIVHADAGELINNLTNNAAQEQARIFLRYVERLQAATADIVVITSLGGHFCVNELQAISVLPVFNVLGIIDHYFKENNIKRIGVLGTKTVMQSRFYSQVSSAEIVLPQPEDLDNTHKNYVAMATSGQASEQQRDFFTSLGKKLYLQQNVDAIVLAGTDLCLVFEGGDFGYPVIDCAQVHVDALISKSAGMG